MAIPGKNSFLLFHDQRQMIEQLSDNKRGKLMLSLYNYSELGIHPDFSDVGLNVAFASIKAAMDRSTEKYKAVVERNKRNGARGGRTPREEIGQDEDF